MVRRIVQSIFFGNYFLGVLVVALSLETAFQMRLPFSSPEFYLFMLACVIVYYTYPYTRSGRSGAKLNARNEWYVRNRRSVMLSQWSLSALAVVLGIRLVVTSMQYIGDLPLAYWVIMFVLVLGGTMYYGLLPGVFARWNLRNTGWLKPFTIGFLWACCVDVLPLIDLEVHRHVDFVIPSLIYWSFLKNWMFCTVNAIMFDFKDYADDSNRHLRTVVVRFGPRRTIFYVLLPLLIIGTSWLILFTYYYHFRLPAIILNLIPFILLIMVAYALERRRSILYYLVVIDGLLLVKACCGIAGSFVTR